MDPERTIGEILRHAREEKGLTLEQVRDATRISLTVLRDLERDRFSELPGPIYVKNTIRVLSDLLEQDRDSLIARYDEAVSGVRTTPVKEALWSEEPVREMRLSGWRPGRWFWIAAAALLVIVALLIWAPWRHQGDGKAEAAAASRDENAQGPAAPSRTTQGSSIQSQAMQSYAARNHVVQSPGAQGTAAQGSAEPPDSTTPPSLETMGIPFLPTDYLRTAAAPPEEFARLRVMADGPARVLVNVDDRRNLYHEFGEAGGSLLLEAEEFFFISATNLDRLSLSLDGREHALPKTPENEISGWRVDAAGAGVPATD